MKRLLVLWIAIVTVLLGLSIREENKLRDELIEQQFLLSQVRNIYVLSARKVDVLPKEGRIGEIICKRNDLKTIYIYIEKNEWKILGIDWDKVTIIETPTVIYITEKGGK